MEQSRSEKKDKIYWQNTMKEKNERNYPMKTEASVGAYENKK